jgi:hypothetical protein
MPTLAQLAASIGPNRNESGEGVPLAVQRIASALEAIGWRAASDTPAEEIAGDLFLIVVACVDGHRDLATLRRDVAEFLRMHAHHLDGSAPAREDWEPAAARFIELYAA